MTVSGLINELIGISAVVPDYEVRMSTQVFYEGLGSFLDEPVITVEVDHTKKEVRLT